MNTLCKIVPGFSYHPEPAKRIIIIKLVHKTSAEEKLRQFSFHIFSGHRYLGRLIGGRKMRQEVLVMMGDVS